MIQPVPKITRINDSYDIVMYDVFHKKHVIRISDDMLEALLQKCIRQMTIKYMEE